MDSETVTWAQLDASNHVHYKREPEAVAHARAQRDQASARYLDLVDKVYSVNSEADRQQLLVAWGEYLYWDAIFRETRRTHDLVRLNRIS